MKLTGKHDKIEFIHNPDFVEWVLKPSNKSDQYWEPILLKTHREKKILNMPDF